MCNYSEQFLRPKVNCYEDVNQSDIMMFYRGGEKYVWTFKICQYQA